MNPDTLPPHLKTAFAQGREQMEREMDLSRQLVESEQHVRQVLQWLAERTFKTDKRRGVCLWYVVSEMFAIGSTRAHRLCEKHGFDADRKVKGVPD